MTVDEIIVACRSAPGCYVKPSSGAPSVGGYSLPQDVVSFYTQCGGIDLFANKPFGISLVSPSEFVKANPVIARVDGEGDISFDWFIVAKAGEQYVTMDLNPTRLGQCYDSFWDRHAVAGSCPVIAKSYAELLAQLLNGRGENWFWLAPDFQGYGDAYDAISH